MWKLLLFKRNSEFKMILWLVSISQLIGTSCIKQTWNSLFHSSKTKWKGSRASECLSKFPVTPLVQWALWCLLRPSQSCQKVRECLLLKAPTQDLHTRADARTLVSESNFFHIRLQTKGMGFESEDWVWIKALPLNSCKGSAQNLWVWTPSFVKWEYNSIWPSPSPLGLLWEANRVAEVKELINN